MQYKLLIVDDDKALVKMLENYFTINLFNIQCYARRETP